MIVNFLHVSADSTDERAAYITGAMSASPSCADAAPRWAAALEANPTPPSLVDPEQWPPLSPEQQAVVDDRIACARRLVDLTLELGDGEVVESDLVSYLASDWGVLPAGTPVVRRTTSRAVIDCLFDDAVVTPDGPDVVRVVRSPVQVDAVGEASDGALGNPIAGIALSIVKSLLEKLGSWAIEQVMGSTVPGYFGEVYQEIRSIVAEQLDVHMIRELTDEFTAKQEWNNAHYLPRKQSGVAPATLNGEMGRKQEEFYSHLAKLKDPAVAHVALGELLIGASMHLAFLQELMNLGVEASWALELKKNAAMDAEHVEKIWPEVAARRKELVAVRATSECWPVNGYSQCAYYWSTYDSATSAWGPRHRYYPGNKEGEKAAKSAAAADRDRIAAEVVTTLSTKLGSPAETAAAWRALTR